MLLHGLGSAFPHLHAGHRKLDQALEEVGECAPSPREMPKVFPGLVCFPVVPIIPEIDAIKVWLKLSPVGIVVQENERPLDRLGIGVRMTPHSGHVRILRKGSSRNVSREGVHGIREWMGRETLRDERIDQEVPSTDYRDNRSVDGRYGPAYGTACRTLGISSCARR